MLAFRPHSGLLAKASTVSARPVCGSAGLLARRVNRSEHIQVGPRGARTVELRERFQILNGDTECPEENSMEPAVGLRVYE